MCVVLYCTMPFIATCVDAIGTVFWDRPSLSMQRIHDTLALDISGVQKFTCGTTPADLLSMKCLIVAQVYIVGEGVKSYENQPGTLL